MRKLPTGLALAPGTRRRLADDRKKGHGGALPARVDRQTSDVILTPTLSLQQSRCRGEAVDDAQGD